MSVNKYVNGKLLQVSGNADTRLTLDDIISILGYTPVNPNIIGTELATLDSSGKLEDSQKPSYSWSEITGKPSTFTPSSHTHSYAGSSSAGGAATSALTLTTARTLTIGNSGKTFDGSTDVSWSLSEIGAASQSDLDILNSNMRNTIIKNQDIWCGTKRTFEITGLTAFSFIIIHVADDGTHGYKRGGLYFCSKSYILQQGTLTGSSCDVNEDLSKIILSGELGMCFSLYLSNANIIVTEV